MMAGQPLTLSPVGDPASDASKRLCLVHGGVSGVRAMPSREVSVITVEIPDEHHVRATMLMHGRHALIVRSAFKSGHAYGVLDIKLGHESDAQGELAEVTQKDALAFALSQDETSSDIPTLLHARVALVRPIPSRAVTAIYLEVPEAQHVEVTNLLHGRDAIVIPVNLPRQVPLGIMRLDQVPASGPTSDPSTSKAPKPTGVEKHVGVAPSSGCSAPSPSRMLSRPSDRLVVTRYLGARCAEAAFQDFLGVRTEAAARDKVCKMCGVESRADIQGSRDAMAAFRNQIFDPYAIYLRQHAQEYSAENEPGESQHTRETPST